MVIIVFWWGQVIMSAYGVNTFVFLGLQVVIVFFLGGLCVAKVGFGRLKVVIGGYEWLSGVCVCVLP